MRLKQHYYARARGLKLVPEAVMYMRVVLGRVDPARVDDEMGRQVVHDVIAALKRLPGNQSYVTGVDRASGRTIAISTWDTKEHARFSSGAGGDIVSRLQALGVQVEPPQIFEVTSD
jgi:hypothetical protein